LIECRLVHIFMPLEAFRRSRLEPVQSEWNSLGVITGSSAWQVSRPKASHLGLYGKARSHRRAQSSNRSESMNHRLRLLYLSPSWTCLQWAGRKQ